MSISDDFIAGALGGAAGVAVGHPFDTVKVQIQTQEFGGKYKSLIDCLHTVKSQSLSKGFFRGMSWPLLTYTGLGCAFFGSYGIALQRIYGSEYHEITPSYMAISIASAFGAAPQLIISCPTEVIKITLQSQIPRKMTDKHASSPRYFSGPTEAVKTIFKTSGIRGIYRGFWTQLAVDIPAYMIYMCSFVFFQENGATYLPLLPSQVVSFIGGGIAGILSCAITLPLDVIKTKVQADTAREFYKGFFDCAKKVYISQGSKAFFLGFVPMSLQAFPVNAITLLVYSECLRLFGIWRKKTE